jgi:hypothetical protein
MRPGSTGLARLVRITLSLARKADASSPAARHAPCTEGAGIHQSAAVLRLPLRSNRGEQRVRLGLASRLAFLFSPTSSRIAPLEAHVCRALRMSLTRTPSTCSRPRHGKDPPQVTYRPWMLRAAATGVALAAAAATFSAFAVAQATRVHRQRPRTGTIRWTTPRHDHDLAPTSRSRSSRSPRTAPRSCSSAAPRRSTHSGRRSHDRPQPRTKAVAGPRGNPITGTVATPFPTPHPLRSPRG